MPDHASAAPSGQRLSTQLFIGVLVIVVGLLMTLDNLGLVRASRYYQFWPAGVIAIGLIKLWHSRDGLGGAFSGVLFTIVGTWLLLEQTAVVELSLRDMWPALLVFLGGFLVWQGWTGSGRRFERGIDESSTLQAMAVLGGVSRGSSSATFRGGDLTAVFGGCELDLRKASIDGEAVVEVFAFCGGIEMRVPDDWTVDSQVVPILGGVDDKTRPPQGPVRHRLSLRGFVVMGGIEIKN